MKTKNVQLCYLHDTKKKWSCKHRDRCNGVFFFRNVFFSQKKKRRENCKLFFLSPRVASYEYLWWNWKIQSARSQRRPKNRNCRLLIVFTISWRSSILRWNNQDTMRRYFTVYGNETSGLVRWNAGAVLKSFILMTLLLPSDYCTLSMHSWVSCKTDAYIQLRILHSISWRSAGNWPLSLKP